MHVLGKVLAVLCMILAAASIYLSAKLLDIRGRWLSEIEKRQQQIVEATTRRDETLRRVRGLDEEYRRSTRLWGDVWIAPNSGPQPGSEGLIELGIGSASGIAGNAAPDTPPTIHVFAADESGAASQYLGEFVIKDMRPDRLVAQLNRPPYPGEMDTWPSGTYRVRRNLPSNWLAAFADIDAEMIVARSNLDAQQLELQNLTRQIQESQNALDQRLAELNGDPNAPPGASQEITDGLVQTVRNYERQRDRLLKEVDEQRHELDRLYVQMRKTLDENRREVEAMKASQEPPSEPAATAPQALVPQGEENS